MTPTVHDPALGLDLARDFASAEADNMFLHEVARVRDVASAAVYAAGETLTPPERVALCVDAFVIVAVNFGRRDFTPMLRRLLRSDRPGVRRLAVYLVGTGAVRRVRVGRRWRYVLAPPIPKQLVAAALYPPPGLPQ